MLCFHCLFSVSCSALDDFDVRRNTDTLHDVLTHSHSHVNTLTLTLTQHSTSPFTQETSMDTGDVQHLLKVSAIASEDVYIHTVYM